MRALSGPRPRVLLLTSVVIVLLAGCAASQLGNMWVDRTFKTDGMRNVLVVAVRNDPVRRRMWEDGFASALAAYGTTAKRSYEIWASATPDTLAVREEVRRGGYDGVLVNHRPPNTAQLTWVQGYSRRESVTKFDPISGASYTTWQDVDVPPTMDTTAVVNYQTDLWSTADHQHGRLVWSGQSHTTDAFSIQLIQYQTESLILPEIARSHLLPPKQK
jgi:hypothetical protein